MIARSSESPIYSAATPCKSDLVARYVGEEFSLTLPETSHDDAYLLAKHTLAGIEAHQWPMRNITISIGPASWRAGMTQAELLSTADKRLYQTKQ